MCGSIQPMTVLSSSPRAYPGDLTGVFLFGALFPAPGHEKETIPHPQDSYLPFKSMSAVYANKRVGVLVVVQ